MRSLLPCRKNDRIAHLNAASGSLVLPVVATFAVQTLISVAKYRAQVLAPVVGPALGVPRAHVGYYITVVYIGSMFGSVTGSAAAGGASGVVRIDHNVAPIQSMVAVTSPTGLHTHPILLR
jgi:hypothetical protein